MPQCWKTQGSEGTARSLLSPGSKVYTCGAKGRAAPRQGWGGAQVVPCIGTLIRRDRVAVGVVNDDVLKRLVHAQEHARLFSSVLLEGRRLWALRGA